MACTAQTKAVVFGLSGMSLTTEEKAFFRAHDPWAYILFARNIGDPEQILTLTSAIRDNVGRFAPVFIDQEGGRVARLGPPHFPTFPPARAFGNLYKKDKESAKKAARLGGRLLAFHLRRVGITGNCLPVLDLYIGGAHSVIGDRAYGSDPEEVSLLGALVAEGSLAGGVLPVMKHLPGHGHAQCDPHFFLPTVEAGKSCLEAGFFPFIKNAHLPAAMTAHIVYGEYDRHRPATLSRAIISGLIRKKLNFGGLLMTDDLSMGALHRFGSVGERAQKAIEAGCDVVLHCSGRLAEMIQVAERVPHVGGLAAERARRCELLIPEVPESYDWEKESAAFGALFEGGRLRWRVG